MIATASRCGARPHCASLASAGASPAATSFTSSEEQARADLIALAHRGASGVSPAAGARASMKRPPVSTAFRSSMSCRSLEVPSSFYSRSDQSEPQLAGACGESSGGGAIYVAALGQRPKQHCALTHPLKPARDRPGDSTGNRLRRHGLRDVAGVASARLVYGAIAQECEEDAGEPAGQRDHGVTLADAAGRRPLRRPVESVATTVLP